MWNFHQRVAPSKGIQDSLGFWIPYHGFRIPGTIFRILYQWKLDSAFQSSAGFRIPWQYSVIQSPGFRIPQAKISCILDSASKIFSDSRIRISLNGNVGSRHPFTDAQNFKSQDWSTSVFSQQYQYIIQKQGYENQYEDHQGEILWFSFCTL